MHALGMAERMRSLAVFSPGNFLTAGGGGETLWGVGCPPPGCRGQGPAGGRGQHPFR